MVPPADQDLPPRVAWAREQCRTLQARCLQLAQARGSSADLEQLLAAWERLLEQMSTLSPDYDHQGRLLLTRLQSLLPELWPEVDRRLLWFFGGDCLHYLSDEEIATFQAAEDSAEG